ncbi:metallophosphoesterase [Planktotalea arctica]|uniref:metallophosphoesterase n=1 Tax=Planktotalea arctica TaxID=1481893 RepID=UPI000A17588D|nr:metallophosphoesterase [Planktotalea arctica]
MTHPIYAIGDIHGQLEMLEDALARIEADGGKNAPIIFLGDYVDRGSDSKAVIARLMDGKSAGKPWRFLKGNHDRMFEWFMEPTPRHDSHLLVGYHWLHERLGGTTTLASYGVDVGNRRRLFDVHDEARKAVPLSHQRFLQDCEISISQGPLFFCHAGVRPRVPLAEQAENDLVWIREDFSHDTSDHGALVVHGHTPVDAPLHAGNHVNLDTGAGYGKPLTAAVFEGTDIHVITKDGRKPLKPA